MNIYENIIVGNFLYGLGFRLGVQHRERPVEPICINLLQQTPLDQHLGDVFLRSSRLIRLIEFKRDSNRSDKEVGKLRMIEIMLQRPERQHLRTVSRQIHWYVNSYTSTDNRTADVFPYLDFQNPSSAISLEMFIERTSASAVLAELSSDDRAGCIEYLQQVVKLQSDKNFSSGALIVAINDRRQLQYVALDDIRELFMTLDLVLERYAQRQKEIDRQRSIERGRSLGRSSRGRSQDFGMER